MSLIKDMRRQRAIWWKRSATKDRFGRYSYDDPVQIKCRWEDLNDQVKNKQGDVIVSNSRVYVDREMSEGDMLKFGPIQSSTHSDPRQESGAREIQAFERVPDIDCRENLLTARL